MSQDLEKLTFEIEKITGQQLIPIKIDKRIIYATPVVVFLMLIATRPTFLYSKKTDEEEATFKTSRLIVYTLIISAFVIGCIFAYYYRRFF
jgi:hypothetical protein